MLMPVITQVGIQFTGQHLFHGIIGCADDTRTQKQTFDIISPVKFDSKFHKLADTESSSSQIVAASVDAVGAIVNAVVGKHDFKQRHTTPVLGKTVANAPACCAANSARRAFARGATGCTRNVVLGRLGKNL